MAVRGVLAFLDIAVGARPEALDAIEVITEIARRTVDILAGVREGIAPGVVVDSRVRAGRLGCRRRLRDWPGCGGGLRDRFGGGSGKCPCGRRWLWCRGSGCDGLCRFGGRRCLVTDEASVRATAIVGGCRADGRGGAATQRADDAD